MLADSPVTTMLPVMDMERARDFYENKLGLKPIGLKPDGKFTYASAGGWGLEPIWGRQPIGTVHFTVIRLSALPSAETQEETNLPVPMCRRRGSEL